MRPCTTYGVKDIDEFGGLGLHELVVDEELGGASERRRRGVEASDGTSLVWGIVSIMISSQIKSEHFELKTRNCNRCML
jgi:hypothetical protein